ncbi:MAG TPA: hypothetical protein VFB72_03585 [Verrucomicrobiae bacterium]|nr:hypothetical protein [Verrucomicrobiae bacterium]
MTKIPFQLGDRQIHAVVHQHLRAVPTMLNVHADEMTSIQAGLANIKEAGGRLIELMHSRGRLITFGLAGKNYTFDPNRIFSDIGIAQTLKKHSEYSQDAHEEIKKFAQAYLHQFALDKEPVIIALHNTTDGIFSVETFLSGGLGGSATAAVHVSPNRSKFDFFYVTGKIFFEELSKRDFNVVLQDNAKVPDDGSLSVYFARKEIPYINIEADIRHLDEQMLMLEAVREMLAEKP